MKTRYKTSFRISLAAKALLDRLAAQCHCSQAATVERALLALEAALAQQEREAQRTSPASIADAKTWNRL